MMFLFFPLLPGFLQPHPHSIPLVYFTKKRMNFDRYWSLLSEEPFELTSWSIFLCRNHFCGTGTSIVVPDSTEEARPM